MEHHLAMFSMCTNVNKSQKKNIKTYARVVTSGQKEKQIKWDTASNLYEMLNFYKKMEII